MQSEQILRDRARRLAVVPAQAGSSKWAEVVLFAVRGERYAIEAPLLRMVHRATNLTTIPCTPPFIAGMLNVRGEVVIVLDLAAALGLPGEAPADAKRSMLLAEHGQVRVGLLVDEVIGIRRLALGALDPPLTGDEFVVGIAEGNTVLLNLERLLANRRFDVFEEVN